MRRLLGVVVLVAMVGAGGCGWLGGEGSQPTEAFDTPAQVLASEAEQAYREGDYETAAELFQQIKDRFPYSRYALLADLRVGDAYYNSGRYDEAAAAYEEFIRLHPTNQAVPYALFHLGMVYYKQMLPADRDPTMARKAAEVFERLVRSFPKSKWAARARPRLMEAYRRLAGHDMAVGMFYYNTGRWKAAAGRFRRVLTRYPDVGLYEKAAAYLAKAQAKMAQGPGASPRARQSERRDLLSPPPPGMEEPVVTLPGEDVGPLPK